MKTIIAGSRTIPESKALSLIYECPWWRDITLVFSGGAKGVDTAGEQFAAREEILVEVFGAEWGKYRKAAGVIRRNAEMAKHADAAIIIGDGKSKGTRDMIVKAKRAGLKMHVHIEGWNPKSEASWEGYLDEVA